MSFLPESNIQIMRHLSRYLTLTNAQLLTLEVSKSLRFIQKNTKLLTNTPTKHSPYVQVVKHPPITKTGRIAHSYSLTQKGAQVLNELFPEEAPFAFSGRVAPVSRDFFHRSITVTAHIRVTQMLRSYPELELMTWHRYFEKVGANHSTSKSQPLHARTRIELEGENRFLIPDVVFLIQKKDTAKSMLICLEISNGKDCKRILTSIARHTEALATQAAGKKYGISNGHRVMYLMTDEGLLRSVLERFLEVPQVKPFVSLFSFAHIDKFLIDPESCWQRVGKPGAYFSFLTGKRAA